MCNPASRWQDSGHIRFRINEEEKEKAATELAELKQKQEETQTIVEQTLEEEYQKALEFTKVRKKKKSNRWKKMNS